MPTTISRYTTQNSTYEVEYGNKRIRRVCGEFAPTPSQRADGEWQTFEDLQRIYGHPGCLLIQWPEGETPSRYTITSQITAETHNTVEETQ